MDREWLEERKRLLRNLARQPVPVHVLRLHVSSMLDGDLTSAVVGIACLIKKAKLRNDYNGEVLAADPRLEGDFVPLVK